MPTVNVHLSDEEHRYAKTQAATFDLTLSELFRRNWHFGTWIGEQRVHAAMNGTEGEPLSIGDAMTINFTKTATVRKRLVSIDGLGHHVRDLEAFVTAVAEVEDEDVADVRKTAKKLAKHIPWKPTAAMSVLLLLFFGTFTEVTGATYKPPHEVVIEQVGQHVDRAIDHAIGQ